MFSLHPQLDSDTITIGDLALSRVLLMNVVELPWIILVPRKDDISEWHNLATEDQLQLHQESMGVSSMLMSMFAGEKLNTGALGNVVSQLHVHHIVRYHHDSVWPKPVWGNIQIIEYPSAQKDEMLAKLQTEFTRKFDNFSAYSNKPKKLTAENMSQNNNQKL